MSSSDEMNIKVFGMDNFDGRKLSLIGVDYGVVNREFKPRTGRLEVDRKRGRIQVPSSTVFVSVKVVGIQLLFGDSSSIKKSEVATFSYQFEDTAIAKRDGKTYFEFEFAALLQNTEPKNLSDFNTEPWTGVFTLEFLCFG